MRSRITALCLLVVFAANSNGQTGGAKANDEKKSGDKLTTPAAPLAELTTPVFLDIAYPLAGARHGDARLLTWSQWLGADLATADAPLRSHLKLNDGEGYVVVGITPDGPATQAGLQVNDVVVGLTDEPKPEATYPVNLWRGGAKQSLTLRAKAKSQWWIGVNLGEIDDAMRSQLSLAAGRGLLVQEVTENSPAQQAGVQKFDVIDGWGDGKASGTVAEFSRGIQESAGKTLSIQIVRHGKTMTIGVTPQKRPVEADANRNAEFTRLLWLRSVQPQSVNTQLRWRLSQADLFTAVPAAKGDRASKLAAVEKQLEQLLKEAQAAREAIEELRKLEEQNKEKPAPEKK